MQASDDSNTKVLTISTRKYWGLNEDICTETSNGLELRVGHTETGLKQELNRPS